MAQQCDEVSVYDACQFAWWRKLFAVGFERGVEKVGPLRIVLVDRGSAHLGGSGNLGMSDLIGPTVEEQRNRSVEHGLARPLDPRIDGDVGDLGGIWIGGTGVEGHGLCLWTRWWTGPCLSPP